MLPSRRPFSVLVVFLVDFPSLELKLCIVEQLGSDSASPLFQKLLGYFRVSVEQSSKKEKKRKKRKKRKKEPLEKSRRYFTSSRHGGGRD